MSSSSSRSSTEDEFDREPKESLDLDLEAFIPAKESSRFVAMGKRTFTRTVSILALILRTMISYPAPGSLQLRDTSWLDGVRGVAALSVYIFHAMGCWQFVVPAWHADKEQNNFLQLPIIRTFFASGGAAVSLFFALSGYVLTHKSLRSIREDSHHLMYPSVASSMFRRGFRLYIPPIILTFCEMLATRFGFLPPLNFEFVPSDTVFGQIWDWFIETNRLANPFLNLPNALLGIGVHPKYDGVVWTIPLEFYGSFVCYGLLLLLCRVQGDNLRMAIVAFFSCGCMWSGAWNLCCFSAGMFVADLNLSQEPQTKNPSKETKIVCHTLFAIAFYLSGFPTLGNEAANINPMPGFETLRAITPNSWYMVDFSRFWWSISGISFLFSISQLPSLKLAFDSTICQYLGKISFSLYLVHEFCIILFGLSFQALLMRLTGVSSQEKGVGFWVLCVVWYILFTPVVFAVAAQVERWVDAPSVRFAKWLEGRCWMLYKDWR